MTSFKIGGLMLKKKVGLNILVAFLLAVSLVSSIFTFLLIDTAKDSMRMYSALENERGVFFRPAFNSSLYWEEGNPPLLGLENIVSSTRDTIVKENKYDLVSVTVYTNYAEKTLNFNVKKGKWLSEVATEENIFHAVASESTGYQVGEIINMYYGTGLNEKGKIKIVGIFDKSTKLPEFGKGPVESFSVLNGKISKPTLIIESKFVKKENEKRFLGNSHFLIFDKELSQSDFNKNIELLRSAGEVIFLEDLFLGSHREIEDNKNMIMPFAILSGVLSIFSLIVIVAIAYDNSKKSLMVLVVCGGKFKDILQSFLVYYFALAGIVLLFSIFGFYFMNVIGVLNLANLKYALSFGGGYFALILLCVAMSSIYISKKALADSFK
ncbi:MAG: hypothetical protein RR357_06740 [Clostridia bacterium]